MNYKEYCYYKLTYQSSFYIFRYISHSNDNIFNTITTSGYVINNGRYYIQNIIFTSETNIIEEVKFSEIVKYLPIGHPERIFFRKNRIKKLLNL